MSQHFPASRHTLPTSLFLTSIAMACLIWFAPSFQSRSVRSSAPQDEDQHLQMPSSLKNVGGQVSERRQLTGVEARNFLQQPGEGQSLMQAITAARFGLRKQDRGPFGEAGGGYLGMSHDQNLNAWFGEEGMTVRPMVAKNEREGSWHMDMRLKAYGYGTQLVPAPPIVSHQVKGNRIEYTREGNFGIPIANLEFQKGALFNSQPATRNPQFLEWYETRAEGIEHGFTIGQRPERKGAVGSDEPLHLVISLQGDLRAKGKDEGRAIELTDSQGKQAVSYSKLSALDAAGRQLAAHMEASSDGGEIALVVDDRGASYPIVIDPIIASQEAILDPLSETGAQSGDSVAIDGERAIIGVWLHDRLASIEPDNGAVYFFTRSGSTWTFYDLTEGEQAGGQCGYSVAIYGAHAVFGCPGTNNKTGKAFLYSFEGKTSVALTPLVSEVGAFFGASVAITGSDIVVGAPLASVVNGVPGNHIGAVHLFTSSTWLDTASQFTANEQFGTSVALDLNTLLVGAPSAMSGTGRVVVLTLSGGGLHFQSSLTASDGAAGDQFGTGVAISGNTAVMGAPGDDDKGTDAGAAYVFVRNASNQWSQQQKLTAGDGKANDIFAYNAVAIEGNTIVVGARRQDLGRANVNDNSGAAYIFTRIGTIWAQQTKLAAGGFYRAPGDEFGTSVDISGVTIIASAPHETSTSGFPNAGASYVYRLDCVPPHEVGASCSTLTQFGVTNATVCAGQEVDFYGYAAYQPSVPITYQWRKNGVNIPAATSYLLILSSATASDEGSYDVILSTACGSELSNPVTLSLHTFSLNPTSQNFGASGSTGIVNVTSTGSCAWTAVSNSNFISVTSGASGSGNGTVGFSVAANTGVARTGSITVAGKTFSVTQDGAAVLVSNVQFSAGSYTAAEGSNSATITVTRSGDTSGAATVDFATGDLVAQQRTDYTIAAGTLAFAAGETSKTFKVLLVDDTYAEGSETLNLTLSNPTGGAALGVPSSATLTITDNDTTLPISNPLDNVDEQFFVRQHFYDFLSRLPDPDGFSYWMAQITQCGNNQTCVNNKRRDVSNAFFFELEYQQTGAYVFRLYRAAFGNNQPFPNPDTSNQTESKKLPNYAVFALDRARVVGGTDLAQGQLNLANVLVQRPAFLAKYPASQDGPAFVDAVLATIRNELGADLTSQRAGLISLFNAGGRGAVLYRLADDNLTTNPINNRAFIDAEYNRAFVATQYFGYLRRDSDVGGFLFWLGQVNSGPLRDANKQHAMVCAFTTSAEYQQRFSSVVTHTNTECQ